MCAEGIQLTAVTCSALVKSCESGRVATAMRLFEHFEHARVEANLVSYNAVISACGNAGLHKQVLEMFAEMSGKHIEADTVTYNSIIAACCKVFAMQEAWRFRRNMTTLGMDADMVTYISFLRVDAFSDKTSTLCNELEDASIRCLQRLYAAG